ncbi:uncharacterized protein LOC132195239 [Neocloeon triangulifer]|uniref:uncharacterized protein LOC132195239 n=1 Tax=Neocloeon triangulifer TaxID=2078957 RepID=UPI00286F81D1|nr:uncharacterized protein LOC132195239 [Neocloeon triangulifer]
MSTGRTGDNDDNNLVSEQDPLLSSTATQPLSPTDAFSLFDEVARVAAQPTPPPPDEEADQVPKPDTVRPVNMSGNIGNVSMPCFAYETAPFWLKLLDEKLKDEQVDDEVVMFKFLREYIPITGSPETVLSLLTPIPPVKPYTTLRDAILTHVQPSAQKRVIQLLIEEGLDGSTPSEFLARMRKIADSDPEHTMLTELVFSCWAAKLPAFVRLAISGEKDLAIAASKADMMMARDRSSNLSQLLSSTSSPIATTAQISAISKATDKSNNSGGGTNSRVDRLETKMDDLTKQVLLLTQSVNNLLINNSNNYKGRSRARSKSRPRDRSSSRSTELFDDGNALGKICYYHKTYNLDARHCTSGCRYYASHQAQQAAVASNPPPASN